jgi:hypothetical protein
MFVMFYWGDHGDVTGMLYMMGETTLIPLRRMGVSICCFQEKIKESKRKLVLVYFS